MHSFLREKQLKVTDVLSLVTFRGLLSLKTKPRRGQNDRSADSAFILHVANPDLNSAITYCLLNQPGVVPQ